MEHEFELELQRLNCVYVRLDYVCADVSFSLGNVTVGLCVWEWEQ